MPARLLVAAAALLVVAVVLLQLLVVPTDQGAAALGGLVSESEPAPRGGGVRGSAQGEAPTPELDPSTTESARVAVEAAPEAKPAPTRLVGRLVDALGAPIASGQLVVERDGAERLPFAFRGAAEDGAFELELPVLGVLTAFAARDPRTSARSPWLYFEAQPGETVDLGLVQLGREHAIAGVARWLDGAPASKVRLGLVAQETSRFEALTSTGEDGSFRFNNVSPGTYQLSPAYDGQCFAIVDSEPVECGQIDLEVHCQTHRIEVEARDPEGRVVAIESLWSRLETDSGWYYDQSESIHPPAEQFTTEVCTNRKVIHSALGVDGFGYHGLFEGPYQASGDRHVLTREPEGLGAIRFVIERGTLPASAEFSLQAWRGGGFGSWKTIATYAQRSGVDEPLVVWSPMLAPGPHEFQLRLRGAGLQRLDRDVYTVEVAAGEFVDFTPGLTEGGYIVVPRLDPSAQTWCSLVVGSNGERVDFVPWESPMAYVDSGSLEPSTRTIDPSRGPWSSEALLPGSYRLALNPRWHRSFSTTVEIRAGEGAWVDPVFERR